MVELCGWWSDDDEIDFIVVMVVDEVGCGYVMMWMKNKEKIRKHKKETGNIGRLEMTFENRRRRSYF